MKVLRAGAKEDHERGRPNVLVVIQAFHNHLQQNQGEKIVANFTNTSKMKNLDIHKITLHVVPRTCNLVFGLPLIRPHHCNHICSIYQIDRNENIFLIVRWTVIRLPQGVITLYDFARLS